MTKKRPFAPHTPLERLKILVTHIAPKMFPELPERVRFTDSVRPPARLVTDFKNHFEAEVNFESGDVLIVRYAGDDVKEFRLKPGSDDAVMVVEHLEDVWYSRAVDKAKKDVVNELAKERVDELFEVRGL